MPASGSNMRCVVLTLLLAIIPLHAQNLTQISPETLPSELQQPLKLLATTALSGEGRDYFTLKPGQTATVGTISGPAIIYRTWSTSSKSAMVSLDLTVDGKREVLYSNGKLPATTLKNDPLRALDMQGYWSYLPVYVSKQAVFRARSVESTEEIKFYLQAGYRAVTADQLVQARKLDLAAARSAARQALEAPKTNVATGQPAEHTLLTGKAWEVPVHGPALATIALELPEETSPAQLQATRLVVVCDGATTLDVPLGALFLCSHKLADYTSLLVAVKGRELLLRAPMPVAQNLQIALQRHGRGALRSAQARVWSQTLPKAPQYRLCAQYFSQVSVEDQPLTLLNTSGKGIFLGTNLSVNGLDRKTFAFLEGNEQIYVDGATQPTIEGTGTEDYFNGAWYFEAGELQHLFHGVTFLQQREPPLVDCYRHMAADSIVFGQSLKFDLQHGSRNKAPNVLYQGVMLWYQTLPVTIAAPQEAKLPKDSGPGAATDAGRALPGVLGTVVLVLLVGGAAFVMLRRRRGGK